VQAVVAAIDEGVDASTAVSTPRIYEQWVPDELTLERDIANDVADALARRGHKVVRLAEDKTPAVQVILRRGGELQAASDPRKGGEPASLPRNGARR